ncbi:unnamed protein product [Closterium sp. NIES-54]
MGTRERGRAGIVGKAAAVNAWQEPIKLVELFGGIGAGLAAVLKAGVAVREWVYVENNEQVRKMAEHHARKLQQEYPELLEEAVIVKAMRGTVTDVRSITREVVRSWGHVDLLVARWECQAVSRAGKGKGLGDPRGALLVNLLCIIDWIKEGQEKVVYLLEHLIRSDTTCRSSDRRGENLED